MKKYIRCHIVKAKPCTLGEWEQETSRTWKEPDRSRTEEGYKCDYPDGYSGWCPKAQFESQGFALEDGSKITERDILNFKLQGYQQSDTFAAPDGKPFTMVQMVYPTGFTDFATSACVDPKNYSEKIGSDICVKKINDRLWGFLGFMLQWAKFGLRDVGMEIAKKVDAEEAKKK